MHSVDHASSVTDCEIQSLTWQVFSLLGRVSTLWCSVQEVDIFEMQTHLRHFDVYGTLKTQGRFSYLFLHRTLEECWPVKVRAELATNTVSLTYRQLGEDGETVEKRERVVKPSEINKLDFSRLFG